MYGQLKLLPESNISRMRVSIGVLPTNRTKNNCSMTEDDTVRREGKRSNNFPNRVGWLGYWLRTYSSSAHWDFSCKLSMWATSDRPQASTEGGDKDMWVIITEAGPAQFQGGGHRSQGCNVALQMPACIAPPRERRSVSTQGRSVQGCQENAHARPAYQSTSQSCQIQSGVRA